MRHVIQALSSQGRGGDDTLLHVSRKELGGLHTLARSMGGQITTNPHTGLPEAYGISNILKIIAPIAAGVVGGPMAGMAAGAALGAVTAPKGKALEGGLFGGMAGYGAGGTGEALSALGSGAAQAAGTNVIAAPAMDLAASGATQMPAAYVPFEATAEEMASAAPAATGISSLPQQAFRATEIAQENAANPGLTGWDAKMAGAKQLWDNPSQAGKFGYDNLKPIGMTVMGTAMNPALTDAEAVAATSGGDNGYRPKYKLVRDANGFQRVVAAAQGGLVGMAAGGLTSIPVPTTPARTTMGRTVGGWQQPSALRDLFNSGNLQVPAALPPRGPTFTPPPPGAMDAYLAQYQALANAVPSVHNYDQAALVAAGNAATPAKAEPAPYNPYYSIPNVGWGGTGGPGSVGIGGDSTGIGTGNDASAAAAGAAAAAAAGLGADAATGPASPSAKGGLVHYAEGGLPGIGQYLRGPGDGMSDHIPAQVGGPGGRQIRVAANEYVVPADVVSHLGNGSSDAGARVLDKMGSKVRAARTGNPKQGKRINPRKFVPA